MIVDAMILFWLGNKDAEICSSLSNRWSQRSTIQTNYRATSALVPSDVFEKEEKGKKEIFIDY